MSTSTTQFNTGPWTNEEHQNFLRGVEAHGRGNWNAIAMLVRTRNQRQVEAHAGQHLAQSAEEQDLEPVETIAVSSVTDVVVGGTAAASPGPALGRGMCYFGNGSILFDWTGVL